MSISPISFDGYNAGITNRYPYTDFHEMNLDFLLSNYASIMNKLNETIDWVNQHQEDYEEAIERLTAVENEIETFETVINAEFARLKADIEADFAQQKAELDAALAQTQAEVNAEIQRMINEVNTAIASFDVRFDEQVRFLNSELTKMKLQINNALDELDKDLDERTQFIFDHVEWTLDEFIKNFPDIMDIIVYNPLKGSYTSIQVAINDLYSVACVYGLTAAQFDSLNMACTEFDATDITASDFDQYSYELLHYPDERYYMNDPFTGEITLIKNVVYKLAELHQDEDSYSATEYDALDMDADTFDATDITAFNFDWYAKSILI